MMPLPATPATRAVALTGCCARLHPNEAGARPRFPLQHPGGARPSPRPGPLATICWPPPPPPHPLHTSVCRARKAWRISVLSSSLRLPSGRTAEDHTVPTPPHAAAPAARARRCALAMACRGVPPFCQVCAAVTHARPCVHRARGGGVQRARGRAICPAPCMHARTAVEAVDGAAQYENIYIYIYMACLAP